MKRELLAGIGMLLAASSVSYAQPAPAAPATHSVPGYPDVKVLPIDTAAKPVTPATQAAGTTVRMQLSDNLKKAGYTDVKVVPEAFIVEAKNKAGEPVRMFLTPDSMTVFTAQDPKGQDTKTAPMAAK
jgi:hypothetical protein